MSNSAIAFIGGAVGFHKVFCSTSDTRVICPGKVWYYSKWYGSTI